MPEVWSNIEVQLIIADYFAMLSNELAGKKYSKAEHRRNILPLLNNRTEGSIEFKHQNISAVLANLGQPFIKGYLPRYNYQKILEENVIEYLSADSKFDKQFSQFAGKQIEPPFYFTRNELDFSVEHSKDYHLYRLFNIENKPKMFIKTGNLGSICKSTALTFKGYF